jgi:hypothetical protein
MRRSGSLRPRGARIGHKIMPLRLLANRGQAREGKQAMSGIQWPGRQEWAERRRDPNWFDHIEVSNRLADYATRAEIDDAIYRDQRCLARARPADKIGERYRSSSISISSCWRQQSVQGNARGRNKCQGGRSNAAMACRPRFSPHSMPGVRRRSKPRYSARSKQCA